MSDCVLCVLNVSVTDKQVERVVQVRGSEADFNRELGRRVKVARNRAGITQGELAAAVDLSRGSVANIERGDQAPPPYRLSLIAAALDVDPFELLPGGEWHVSPVDRLSSHLSTSHADAVASVRAVAARHRRVASA